MLAVWKSLSWEGQTEARGGGSSDAQPASASLAPITSRAFLLCQGVAPVHGEPGVGLASRYGQVSPHPPRICRRCSWRDSGTDCAVAEGEPRGMQPAVRGQDGRVFPTRAQCQKAGNRQCVSVSRTVAEVSAPLRGWEAARSPGKRGEGAPSQTFSPLPSISLQLPSGTICGWPLGVCRGGGGGVPSPRP